LLIRRIFSPQERSLRRGLFGKVSLHRAPLRHIAIPFSALVVVDVVVVVDAAARLPGVPFAHGVFPPQREGKRKGEEALRYECVCGGRVPHRVIPISIISAGDLCVVCVVCAKDFSLRISSSRPSVTLEFDLVNWRHREAGGGAG